MLATRADFLGDKYSSLPFITIGYSAGAYLALLNGGRGAKVDGICAFAGYGDLAGDWYCKPSQFFIDYKNVDYVAEKIRKAEPFMTTDERVDLYIYLRQKGLWPEYVLGKETLAERIKDFSPISHITDSYPRTVLIHGDADSDVPASASVEMAMALRKHSVLIKHIELKGLDHDLFAQLDNASVLGAWNEALEFLNA